MQSVKWFLFAICLGLLAYLSVSVSVIQAAPSFSEAVPPRFQAFWLVLDSSQPEETLLAPLFQRLTHMKAETTVFEFSFPPQEGVLRVVAMPEAVMHLRQLPGVVAVETAPPASFPAAPPPSPPPIQALASGHITGTVTDGTDPLAGIDVTAYYYDGSYWQTASSSFTDSTGGYDLSNLDTGTYRIEFRDWNGTYLDEYYDDAADLASATDVSVTDGNTTPNINAVLAPSGHISGTVTNGTDPLGNIYVEILRYSNNTWASFQSGITDATGAYDVDGLPTGGYKVKFSDPDSIYHAEYYNDILEFESATIVSVTAGNTTPNIDAVLDLAGHITGTVTNGTDPLENIGVTVYRYTISDYWQYVNSDFTNGVGAYDVGGLAPGTYRVLFPDLSGNYFDQYYIDARGRRNATSLLVSAGNTTSNIDAVLSRAGHIAGTVTNGTDPLANIMVTAHRYDGRDWVPFGLVKFTNSAGHYDVGGLDTGSYRVQFRDGNGTYFTQYYNQMPGQECIPTVPVTAGNTTSNIDVELALAGHITGMVTDGTNPLSYVTVDAYRYTGSDWEGVASTFSLSGAYDLGGLATGTYRLEFRDYGNSYALEYYDNVSTIDTATDLSVTAGSTLPNIDATLNPAGHIAGTVTDGTNPIANRLILVYRQNGSKWEQLGWAGTTDSTGNYDIGGLSTGTYRVLFHDWAAYAFEYYHDASVLAGATDIAVTSGSTVSGIDAVLAPAGRITGIVTDGTNPLEDVFVSVVQANGEPWGQTFSFFLSNGTGPTGTYDIGGLATGSYRLKFQDAWYGPYATQYYDDALTTGSATDISVTQGSTTSDINVVMGLGGRITGLVTDGTNPLPNIKVTVFGNNGSSWEEVGSTATGCPGTYAFGDLPAGSYRVQFEDEDGIYRTEYYDDKLNLASGTDVAVGAGSTVPGIDAVLGLAGHITGTVTNGTDPLAGITVTAYQHSGSNWEPVGSATTNAGGIYDVGHLPAGTCRVGFSDPGGLYAGEYYDDATTLASANDLTLTGGTTISNINAILSMSASKTYLPTILK